MSWRSTLAPTLAWTGAGQVAVFYVQGGTTLVPWFQAHGLASHLGMNAGRHRCRILYLVLLQPSVVSALALSTSCFSVG